LGDFRCRTNLGPLAAQPCKPCCLMSQVKSTNTVNRTRHL
jgi:hypothetical protein